MARNRVQFQEGLSDAFDRLYGAEEKCRGDLRLAMAGRLRLSRLRRAQLQPDPHPRALPVQHLPAADLAHRRHHLRRDQARAARLGSARSTISRETKGGISSIELGRRLGVTQTTAWKIKHKLMQVMMERDAGKRLAAASRSTTPTSAASAPAASAAVGKRHALEAHRSQLGGLITDDPSGFVLGRGTIARLTGAEEAFWRPCSAR